MGSVGDVAFRAFTPGLSIATLYLAGTFFVNFYHGLSWRRTQSLSSPTFLSLFFSIL
ncbi:hypothetical protein COCNU_08G005020 [Cocos nucifera]|uniref:Uncharacterized protein n=1 Tax=Cocos nucifera TaxID=13894 RepID=A0A8K0IHQ7_COCNU|nr:hypothetical protein COCNU_08G005020 [Cocos nucifera]